MESELSQLKSYLYRNPNYMNIYEEAVKNSLDAGANNIEIIIQKKKQLHKTELTIIDDGNGFSSESFKRFSVLGKNQDTEHKGLGRVVYLIYFNKVTIKSNYFENFNWYSREIIFNDQFNIDSATNKFKSQESVSSSYKTQFCFSIPISKKLHDSKFIDIHYIKSFLYAKFLSEFYLLNKQNRSINILIKTDEEDEGELIKNEICLRSSDFPKFEEYEVNINGEDLFDIKSPETKILYKIEKNYIASNQYEKNIITAICVDGRAFEINIIDVLPEGYKVIFLLYSEEKIFVSKPDRSGLDIDHNKFKIIEDIFRENVIRIIESNLPEISKINKSMIRDINKKYPFLIGYVSNNGISLYRKEKLVDDALSKYQKEKKSLLDLDNLSDQQFDDALKVSSRVLTEYILHRETIIKKIDRLSKIKDNDETLLHNVIVPQKDVYRDSEIELQRNNIWLFDDKFMSFSTVLSEKSIKDLFKNIGDDRTGTDDRPDISIVFSKGEGEAQQRKSDVVIVELKGQNPHKNDLPVLIKQIVDRAKVLVEKYPNKINRIWYYGVLGLDDKIKRDLYGSEHYKRMFSNDEYWYGQETFIPDYEVDPSKADKMQVDFFLLSYKALIEDAKSRNSTFLNLIRENLSL